MKNNYQLMHKDVIVAVVSLDGDNGRMLDVKKVITPEHLPIGTAFNNDVIRKELKSWWDGRSIPASRDKLELLLKKLNIKDTTVLLTKSLGLSLSDCYWIRPEGADIKWGNINYYENNFSADIGNILFGKESDQHNINEASPDNTSDGWLQKRWKISNGERILVKAGSEPFEQEPFNEVIASRLMSELGIEHVDYKLLEDENKTFCYCHCYASSNAEFVAASRIYHMEKARGYESPYQHYINVCENLGISDAKEKTNKMLFLDYVIANSDRHYGNFGILRNPDTLKAIDIVPIFDSGSSLGYKKSAYAISNDKEDSSKPFRSTHQEQIKLVKDLSWVNLPGLNKFESIVRDVFSGKENVFGSARIDAIIDSAQKRIDRLFGSEKIVAFSKTPMTKMSCEYYCRSDAVRQAVDSLVNSDDFNEKYPDLDDDAVLIDYDTETKKATVFVNVFCAGKDIGEKEIAQFKEFEEELLKKIQEMEKGPIL